MAGFVDILGFKIPDARRQDLPTGIPLQENGTGAAVVPFMTRYLGYAVDAVIDNTDAVQALVYRVNGRTTMASKTIPVGGVANIEDAKIVLIEIVSGGTWQISFNLIPVVKY